MALATNAGTGCWHVIKRLWASRTWPSRHKDRLSETLVLDCQVAKNNCRDLPIINVTATMENTNKIATTGPPIPSNSTNPGVNTPISTNGLNHSDITSPNPAQMALIQPEPDTMPGPPEPPFGRHFPNFGCTTERR